MRSRLVVIVVLAVVGGALYLLTHRSTTRAGVIEGSGTIEATQVDLAPKVSGRITRLAVKEGDVVKRGQVLVELDGIELQEQLDSARAGRDGARDRVRSARAQLALERDQYAANLRQAQAAAQTNVARVPQAGESLRLQQGTVAAQIRQVEAQVSSARASLAAAEGNAQAAAQAWLAARANVVTAQANLSKARQDNSRFEQLFRQDAVSQEQRDTSRTALQGAQGQLDAARAQVAAAQAQQRAAVGQREAAAAAVSQSEAALQLALVNRRTVPIRRLDVAISQAALEQARTTVQVAEAARARITQREHDLAAARASLREAEAALALAQTNRDNAALRAPFDATVLSKNFEVGDLVSVGSPIVTVADMQHPYLRVFVGEALVARIKLGQKAGVRVDALPNRVFDGRVDEIRQKAEYIPGNVQTKDERAKLVFGVRLRLDNPGGELKPGLPADAVIEAP